jgi:L-alanine-DL-glutamate epimerase-like enolase superfamily enzyme
MKLDHRVTRLNLIQPLRISRGVMSERDTVCVSLVCNGIHGHGEVVTSPRLGLDTADIERGLDEARDWLAGYANPGEARACLSELRSRLRHALPVAAAVDSALHDWLAIEAGVPLHELLGLPPWDGVPTAFTIGICPPPQAAAEATAAARAGFTVLKVKLGSSDPNDDIARVQAIRAAAPTAELLADPNGAWDAATAIPILGQLQDYGVVAVEQPVPAGHLGELAEVAASTQIPIVADEDAGCREDLDVLPAGVAGINIKLAECGGLDAAMSMIGWARHAGVDIMLGCQVSTSLSIAAAAHLSGVARWVDLDGHLLITGDPWGGLGGSDGLLRQPAAAGLGVVFGGAA